MIAEYFRKLNYITVLLMLALALFAISCSDDPVEPSIDEAQVLLEYLEGNGDFINTLAPTMVGATDVNNDAINPSGSKFYIIDIRSAADFADGHIKGAKNMTETEIITHVKTLNKANYDKIVIACYTGQTASFYVSLLRLLGYDNAFALKWGMASWSKSLANKWTANLKNDKTAFMETTDNTKPAKGKLPTIKTGKKTGAEILEARIAALIAEGGTEKAKVTNTVVFENPTNYYIANYWPQAQYLDPGHIPGAIQYTPKLSLKSTEDLLTLPTDKPIVLYCYTGQTSFFLAAYLRLLGYDAKSLLFGANGMIYDAINGKQGFTYWNDAESFDYELEK